MADLFSRRIVGWAMQASSDWPLVSTALQAALRQRCPAEAGLLYHIDRCSQYASAEFQRLLRAWGIACSMSRRN